MSTLFKSNAVAHSDEELLQRSAIVHEVLAECPESFLQLFLTSTLTLLMGLLQLRYEHDSSTIQHPTRSYVLASNNEHVNSFALL